MTGADELLGNLGERPAWMRRAACRGTPVAQWMPTQGEPIGALLAVCSDCAVRAECRDYALDFGPRLIRFFGGTSALERRRVLREAS